MTDPVSASPNMAPPPLRRGPNQGRPPMGGPRRFNNSGMPATPARPDGRPPMIGGRPPFQRSNRPPMRGGAASRPAYGNQQQSGPTARVGGLPIIQKRSAFHAAAGVMRPRNAPDFNTPIPAGYDVQRGDREAVYFEPLVAPTADSDLKLKIYALGGLEEIGRNCTVLECGDDIIIVDVGLMFPEEGMPGIDYIIPNVATFKGREKNIRGVIITHGHLDHVGAISHVLPKIGNPPIYTAPLTAGIVRARHEEYPHLPKLNMVIVQHADERFHLGKNFIFEPFHINHTISDAFGVAIHTPFGPVLITGDFKFDFTPVNEEPADLGRIAMYGSKGVLALLSDSTAADIPGHQISEQVVYNELDRVIGNAESRIIVGTFSSLLTRVQIILALAEKYGRKVLIQGRSMQKNVDLAHELGYLQFKPGTIIDENDYNKYRPENLLILCTGAQGEEKAALMRIATGEHRFLKLEDNDTVIFSSSVVPGNERSVQRLKDTLVRHGANVVHSVHMDVHAGGHAKQEDLKLMLRLTKPKHFMPIHGNRFMLAAHGRLAAAVGVEKENIFIADNGQVVQFDVSGGRLTEERHPAEYVMVDGLGVGDVSEVILRDRMEMSQDGMLVVIATIEESSGALIGAPDIISRGFILIKDNQEILDKTRALVQKIMDESDHKSPAFDEYIKTRIRNDVGQFLFNQTKRRPMVLPVIIEV